MQSEADALTDAVAAALAPLGRVAIALSGGVDSVTLLALAARGGADVCAVHVDHGLRPDSADDAAFCAELAVALGVAFEAVRLTITPGNSTQGRARIQRYAALVRAAGRLGADALATAHHRDDAVETALLQRDRNAGPTALAGLRALGQWQGFPLARPLLSTPRAVIEGVAAQLGQAWIEDPTNTETRYERNRLRHDVIPHLPDAAVDLFALRTAADALEADVAELAARALLERGPVRRTYRRDVLAAARPEAVTDLLARQAHELHGELGRGTTASLHQAIGDGDTRSRVFCGRQLIADVDAEHVVFEATRGQGTRLVDARSALPMAWNPDHGETVWFGHHLGKTEDPADGDFVVPAGTVLTVRGPRPGDRIFVPTLGGQRMIHDVLADASVPHAHRWRWPCIWNGERCIWVAAVGSAPNLGAQLSPDGSISGIFVRPRPFPFVHSEGRVDTAPAESTSAPHQPEPERR